MGMFDDFIFLRDKPSIQTMASASFTLNSIILMLSLFAAMSSDDAAVQLKLNAVDSTPQEIKMTSYSRMVACYISILVDLFLIIGIEDNCRAAMVSFMWWNWFYVFVDTLTITGFAIWKGTSDNVTLVIICMCVCGILLFIKGFCARRVYFYSLAVRQPEQVQQSVPPAVRERISGSIGHEFPAEAVKQDTSREFMDDDVEPETISQ